MTHNSCAADDLHLLRNTTGNSLLGKIATPADIAPAYLYLMQNEFMTGETIHIDGGQRLVRGSQETMP